MRITREWIVGKNTYKLQTMEGDFHECMEELGRLSFYDVYECKCGSKNLMPQAYTTTEGGFQYEKIKCFGCGSSVTFGKAKKDKAVYLRKKDGQLDESAACRIIDHLLDGNGYPFILGTTGESASIPAETRFQYVKRVTAYLNEKKTCYAGISDNCLENTVNYAKQYYDLGVNIFVVHVPSYYPLTPDLMLKYYERLADQSPGPIMIYNIKSTTNMSIPLDVIEKLSHHPNIAGLKDSERDMDRLQTAAQLFSQRSDFSIFCGWTAQSATVLLMDFDGIVPSTGNVIPKMFHELYQAVVAGNEQLAKQVQAKIDAFANIHQQGKTGVEAIAALKVMMSELGLCEPWVLPPLARLSPDDESKIRGEMGKLKIS